MLSYGNCKNGANFHGSRPFSEAVSVPASTSPSKTASLGAADTFAIKKQQMVHPTKHGEQDKHINGKKKSHYVSTQRAWRTGREILVSRGG